MKTSFFESLSGNKSSSRLIAFIVIMCSLLFTALVLIKGLSKEDADVIIVTTAAGTFFIQMAGTAMFFMFQQKKNEIKQEGNKDETN